MRAVESECELLQSCRVRTAACAQGRQQIADLGIALRLRQSRDQHERICNVRGVERPCSRQIVRCIGVLLLFRADLRERANRMVQSGLEADRGLIVLARLGESRGELQAISKIPMNAGTPTT